MQLWNQLFSMAVPISDNSGMEMGRCHREARRLSFVGDEEMTFRQVDLSL
jgi:hypothetical protein